MMTLDELLQSVRHPGNCSREGLADLRMLRLQHPGSGFLTMLYLEHLFFLEDPSFKDELSRLALQLPDPLLFWKRTRGTLSQAEPPVLDGRASDSTLSLIDSFLKADGAPLAEDLEFQYAPEYVSLMEHADDGALMPDEQIDRVMEGIGKTLQNRPAMIQPSIGEDVAPDATPIDADVMAPEDDLTQDNFLTETLARIYIKQKRYDKALEILKRISLINPKKSAYFADQIRFLEKLIINTKTK